MKIRWIILTLVVWLGTLFLIWCDTDQLKELPDLYFWILGGLTGYWICKTADYLFKKN